MSRGAAAPLHQWASRSCLYGSVPLGYSTTFKKKYDEIKFILEKISYQ